MNRVIVPELFYCTCGVCVLIGKLDLRGVQSNEGMRRKDKTIGTRLHVLKPTLVYHAGQSGSTDRREALFLLWTWCNEASFNS